MQDLRRAARYSASCVIAARAVSNVGDVPENHIAVHGELRDISGGGFCFASKYAYQDSTVLRCEIFPPGFPVGVPTLARVQWSRQESPAEFRIGLQFLLE